MSYGACLRIPLDRQEIKEAKKLLTDLIEDEVFGECSEIVGLQLDLYMKDLVAAGDAISSGLLDRFWFTGSNGFESRPVCVDVFVEAIPLTERGRFLDWLLRQALVCPESQLRVGYDWHFTLHLSDLGRITEISYALCDKEQSYQACTAPSEAVSEAVANCGGVPETMELAAHVPDASQADIDEAFEALDRLRVAHAELQLADAKYDRLSRLRKDCDDDDLADQFDDACSDLVDAERTFIEEASTLIPLRVYNTLFKGLRGLK